jgi:TolB protein
MNGIGKVAVLLLLAGCGRAPELALVSDRGGDGLDVWLTTADTARWVNLSSHAGEEYSLTWSPDGSRLLFRASWPGEEGLYVVNADGSGLRQLGADHAAAGRGAWSPDGDFIAYASTRYHPERELYLMESRTGRIAVQLTDNDVMDDGPAWSPDGRWIAFTRFFPHPRVRERGTGDLFMIRPDGTDERRLTTSDDESYNGLPSWSPDSRDLAYHRCVRGRCQLRILDVSSGESRALVEDGYDNRWPEWSPDGEWIAYTSVRDGQTDIWRVRPDGTEMQPLITGSGRDEIAVWRP